MPPESSISTLNQKNTNKKQDVLVSKVLILRSKVSNLKQINNEKPFFNYGKFTVIKSQAGLNNYKISVKEWTKKTKARRNKNPDQDGNIRDGATLEQLVVLSNPESINSVLIHQGIAQDKRLIQLNRIAITQMKSLLANKSLKKLKSSNE